MTERQPPSPQRRTLAIVGIVAVMLLGAVAPASIGIVAGQAANGTTATNTTATTTGPPTASGGNASASGTGSNRRVKRSLNPTSTTGTAGSASNGGSKSGKSNVPPGVVQMNESWDEFSGNRAGSNGTGNTTNGTAGGGGGDGGGGIADTAADVITGAASGAYDIAAGLGDWALGSSDEWLGGFTKGAKAFFSWMMGFFVKQAMGILSEPLKAAVNAMTMTPHANNVGSYYTPPTNSFEPLYQTWKQTGKPAAWLMWLVSVTVLIGFGNYLGVGMIDHATEKQAATGLALSTFFLTDFAWIVSNVFLHTLDIVGRSVTVNIQTSLATAGFSGMMLILVLILAYFEAFAAIMLLAIAAFRIEFIMALTPFIGVLVIARVSPIKGASSLSNFVLQLWGILAVAGIPAAFLLDAAFSMAKMALAGKLSAIGTMMAVPMVLGGIAGAALMPFLLLKGRNTMFSGTFGVAGLSGSGEKMQEKMDEYEEKARRPGRFARGVRGKDPATDERATAHRAGQITRAAGSKARSAPGTARSAAGKARSAAGKARHPRQYAKQRAADMKQRLNRRSGNSSTPQTTTSELTNELDAQTMKEKLDAKSNSPNPSDD